MKALLIILAVLVFITLILAIIKAGVEITLGEKNRVCVYIGGFKFDSDSFSKLQKKKPKEKKEKKPKKKKNKKKTPVNKLYMIKAAFELTGKLLRGLHRHLVFRMIKCHIGVATDDAAQTAMAYGGISAGVNVVCGMLCNSFTVKKRDIKVSADFDSQKITYDIFIKSDMTLLDGFIILISVGIAALKAVHNINKQKKAV